MQKENKAFDIQPARRVSHVQEYYFSKKLKEVAEMNAAGKNVINLGIGIPELRKGFADWYKKWYHVDLDSKTEIQPLIGSKEGILHISLAFLNPGDGVLVPNPGYPTYTSVSNLVQARILTYDLDEANGWHPDFEALERMD